MSDQMNELPRGFIMITINGKEHLVNTNAIALVVPTKTKEGSAASIITFTHMMYANYIEGTTKKYMEKMDKQEFQVKNTFNQSIVPIAFQDLVAMIRKANQ